MTKQQTQYQPIKAADVPKLGVLVPRHALAAASLWRPSCCCYCMSSKHKQAALTSSFPLRRFHIQADFILPSSREGILEDRQWNRWLQQEVGWTRAALLLGQAVRQDNKAVLSAASWKLLLSSCCAGESQFTYQLLTMRLICCLPVLALQLAPAFVQQVMQAVAAHQQHSQRKGHSSGTAEGSPGPTLSPAALLQYLPLPGDVLDDFMAQVSTAILQGLQQQACVLTAAGQLSTAQHTVLPDGLLVVNGQQLISSEWLQAGLPELEYVHADLLAGPRDTVQRSSQVLLQLGSSKFCAALLLSWLNSEGTARLLGGLEPEDRAEWLQLLYSCCMKLRAQPDTAPMHLAADSSSRQALRSASTVQLHGSRELVSLQQLADTSKKLYLWDDRFGGQAEMQLFSTHSSGTCAAASGGESVRTDSSSGSESHSSKQLDWLCFVDPSTLGADGAAMLGTFLDVSPVPLSMLVKHVLQQQAEGGLSDAQHDQLLLFLLRNAPDLSSTDLQLLQESLLLRCAGEADSGPAAYAAAKQLYLPLEFSSLPVTQATLSDPALQQDLAAAGVAFVSKHYGALEQPSQKTGRQGVWQLLGSFGLQQLTLQSAVQHLLKLYGSDTSVKTSLADHERHLGFLAQCGDDTQCLQHIQDGLRLYEKTQNATVTTPVWRPGQVFWPLSETAGAEAFTKQLQALCDVCLVHPWYVEHCEPAIQGLVQDITQTLSLAEVRSYTRNQNAANQDGAVRV
jgi:hypothetical protein